MYLEFERPSEDVGEREGLQEEERGEVLLEGLPREFLEERGEEIPGELRVVLLEEISEGLLGAEGVAGGGRSRS